MIEIINETVTEINADILQTIFDWMKADSVFQASDTCCLKISNNNEIRAFNSKYRGKNSLTDVLTFPCEFKNIPFKGDIIIDIAEADKQKGNHSLEKEICELFIHGLLHLAGMDHISKKQQTQMSLFEEKYKEMLSRIQN